MQVVLFHSTLPPKNHENRELCSACGGKCCKNKPGAYLPSDFQVELTVESVMRIIKNGNVGIDWYEGKGEDPNIYFLRPTYRNEKFGIDPYDGECINLGPNGCLLLSQVCPFACRNLIPSNNNGDTRNLSCSTHPNGPQTLKEIAQYWLPYNDIISEVDGILSRESFSYS